MNNILYHSRLLFKVTFNLSLSAVLIYESHVVHN